MSNIERTDINVGSIEKDIKRCEQLIKPEHANWIGISNQLAIAHVVDRVKELEEENYVQKVALLENSIPKQKVKDKIEELKLSGGSNGKDNVENLARELVIEVLEELLEGK